jgi:hypothetical protein
LEGAEEIGAIATGALVARTIEPQAGEGDHQAHGRCLNCAAEVERNYCPECGQAAHVHRTLSAFFHDLLHGVLHFEGKTWRTLPMLVWHPGKLTRRYIEGERARFVSPMALFLFSVFLMFAVFGWTGGPIRFGEGQTGQNFDQGMTVAVKEAQESLAELEQDRAKAVAEKRSPAALDEKIKEAREEIAMLQLMKERGVTEATMTRVSDDLTEAPGWFAKAYKKAQANPSLLIYKLQNSAYKFSWALIPISVPFVWLLFLWRRKFKLYDHTVFVTYSLTFMTLLVIAASIFSVMGVGKGWIVSALTFIPPVHMYRHLRGGYSLSRFSALWRTFFLLIFASVASGLFFTLLLMLGVLG